MGNVLQTVLCAGKLVKNAVGVAGVIAGENGNIIKLEHNQFVTINRNSAVELVITIEAFGPEHKEQILRVLSEQ